MSKTRELREEMRAPTRADVHADPAERVRLRKGTTTVDPYHIPSELLAKYPDTSFEWKRTTVLGESNFAYERAVQDQGWRPCDKAMFRGQFGKEEETGSITVNGLTLMERPAHLTAEAKAEHKARAKGMVKTNERSLGNTPEGTAERVAVVNGRRTGATTTLEPLAVGD